MTVRMEQNAIVVVGKCGVEEADSLVEAMNAHPDLPVDLTSAELLHTAIWQALLMAQPLIVGTPMDTFSASRVLPALMKNFQGKQNR